MLWRHQLTDACQWIIPKLQLFEMNNCEVRAIKLTLYIKYQTVSQTNAMLDALEKVLALIDH